MLAFKSQGLLLNSFTKKIISVASYVSMTTAQFTSAAGVGEALTCGIIMLGSLINRCFVTFYFYKIYFYQLWNLLPLDPNMEVTCKSAVPKCALNEHIYFTLVLVWIIYNTNFWSPESLFQRRDSSDTMIPKLIHCCFRSLLCDPIYDMMLSDQ